MSIGEIETAVDRLTVPEQKTLLRRLEENLRHREISTASTSREGWIRRLESIRAKVGSSAPASSSELILTELRED
jgi:hypothetical protein